MSLSFIHWEWHCIVARSADDAPNERLGFEIRSKNIWVLL